MPARSWEAAGRVSSYGMVDVSLRRGTRGRVRRSAGSPRSARSHSPTRWAMCPGRGLPEAAGCEDRQAHHEAHEATARRGGPCVPAADYPRRPGAKTGRRTTKRTKPQPDEVGHVSRPRITRGRRVLRPARAIRPHPRRGCPCAAALPQWPPAVACCPGSAHPRLPRRAPSRLGLPTFVRC